MVDAIEPTTAQAEMIQARPEVVADEEGLAAEETSVEERLPEETAGAEAAQAADQAVADRQAVEQTAVEESEAPAEGDAVFDSVGLGVNFDVQA